MVKDQPARNAGHKIAHDVHLGVVDVAIETATKVVQHVDPGHEIIRQGQRPRIGVNLDDPADALDRQVLVTHLRQQPAHTLPPFQRGHGHDPPDPRVAPRLLLDKGITLQIHHRLDLQVTAVALVIFDMTGIAIQRLPVKGRIFQSDLVPDMTMAVDDRKSGMAGPMVTGMGRKPGRPADMDPH